MKSLPPQDYRALPQLALPAGYICVIRDIGGGCYRLEGASNVAELINAALDEVSKKFGIELISILETDDIKATESALYADHHAKLSSAWLELDPYQLQELASSLLDINAYSSLYLTSQQIRDEELPSQPRSKSDYETRAASYLGGTHYSATGHEPLERVGLHQQFGLDAMRSSRRRQSTRRRRQRHELVPLEYRVWGRLNDLLTRHPGCFLVFVILLIIAFVLLMNQPLNGYFALR